MPRIQGSELPFPEPFPQGWVCSRQSDAGMSSKTKIACCLLTVHFGVAWVQCSCDAAHCTWVDDSPECPVPSQEPWSDLRARHTGSFATAPVTTKSSVFGLDISRLLPAPWNSNKLACQLVCRHFTISYCLGEVTWLNESALSRLTRNKCTAWIMPDLCRLPYDGFRSL